MEDLKETGKFTRYNCPSCGGTTDKAGKQCNTCYNDTIMESDGYSHKSGRKDNSDTWVMRFEQGIEMQNMAYNDSE